MHYDDISIKKKNYQFNVTKIIRIWATNIHPAIAHFIGYCFKSKYFYLFLENKDMKSLYKLNDKMHILNLTDKLIILYGIATVLELLHSRNIMLREFQKYNILVDSQFYPYIFEFVCAYYIDEIVDEDIHMTNSVILMSPEIMNDPEKYVGAFPVDVYAYGVNMFTIITEEEFFGNCHRIQIGQNVTDGKRPKIPDSTPSNWKDLIERCWHQDPNKRPNFTEICDLLESGTFVNSSINIVAFNDYKKIVKPYRPIQKSGE